MKFIAMNSKGWDFMEDPLSGMIAHGDDLDKVQSDIKTYLEARKTYFRYGVNAVTIYDVSGDDLRVVYCYVAMGDTHGHMELMREGWSYIDACSKLPDEYGMYRPENYSGII